MRNLAQIGRVGAAGIAAVFLLMSGQALAGHGKAGLWSITMKMNMPGMNGMPDMSKLPPEVQARMQAMHVNRNSGGITMRHCMTQAEVDNAKPPVHNKSCTLLRYKTVGKTYMGDISCTGEFTGTGHTQVTYDSDEHYTGSTDIQGTHNGQPVNMHTTFEGKWISASCEQ